MKTYITSLLLGLVIGFLASKSYNDLYYKSMIEDYQKMLAKKQEEVNGYKAELLQTTKELEKAYQFFRQSLSQPQTPNAFRNKSQSEL
jgi:uncharacterized membrane-anchored protein YhcB (DUF1043 family)